MALGKLSRFEKLFRNTIIERGCDYENMGRVTQLSKQSVSTHGIKTKQYVSYVIGSRSYQVKLLLTDLPDKDMVIESMSCQCPYDDYCKHMVAMLLKVRTLQAGGQLPTIDSATGMDCYNDVGSAEVLDGIIDKDKMIHSLDEKALRNFVQHCFLRHPELIDELVIWHSQYQAKAHENNAHSKVNTNASAKQDYEFSNLKDERIQDISSKYESFEHHPIVLQSLYRQIDSLLDLDDYQLYGYEPDVSEPLYQFDMLFNQFTTQPQYQLSMAIYWMDTILRLYDEYPDSDLYEPVNVGFAKLGKVLFNVEDNDYGIGYLPDWSQDFTVYHTYLPDTLITEIKEKIQYWQYEGDIRQISDNYHMERLYFDLFIAKQDWLGAVNFLNQSIEKTKISSYRDFELKNMMVLKIGLLNYIHNTPKLAIYSKVVEPVAQLIKDYQHLPAIRLMLINNAMQEGKLEDAMSFIEEGVRIAKRKDRGYHSEIEEWQIQFVNIASQALKNDTLQTKRYDKDKLLTILRDNSKALAIEASSGTINESYYQQWKDSYTETEWQKTIKAKQVELQHSLQQSIDKSINDAPSMNSYFSRSTFDRSTYAVLIQIYELEKQSEALSALIKAHPDIYYIKRYQDELIANDASWLIYFYLQHWQKCIENVGERKHYHELAQDIQIMLEALPEGKKVWQPMVAGWQARFSTKPRRPALLDELSKIRWGNDG